MPLTFNCLLCCVSFKALLKLQVAVSHPVCSEKHSVTDFSLLNSGSGRTEQMIQGAENAFNGRNLSSLLYLIKLRNEENLNPGPCEF